MLSLITLAGIAAALSVAPIPQDPAYHAFVDGRQLLGVANFWNVISNVGYVLAGVYGLCTLGRLSSPVLRPAYVVFCISVICVGFGSSYYHYAPSTGTLVWDRLPMSMAFMALFSAVLSDRVNTRLGRALLSPLLVLGVASVLYWAWSEHAGMGDLRPYALVQFLPVILLPLMLLAFPGSQRSTPWLWGMIAAYVLAKLAEISDAALYTAAAFSGHSIKHILSSLAVFFAVAGLQRLDPPPRDE